MIEPNVRGLSVGKQCVLLSISRSSFYYDPKGETGMNLDLMRLIDKQFLETPFYGVRQMTWHLRNEGHVVNEKRIRRLMRLMGLMLIYQKLNTSKAAKGHKIHPYLLRKLAVTRPRPSLGDGHHLYSDGAGLHLFGHRTGLVHAPGSGKAGVDHLGGRLLHSGCRRGADPARQARDIQHGLGGPSGA